MKTIINLTGAAGANDFTEPPFHHHNNGETHQVTGKGKSKPAVFVRVIRSGPAGIIFTNGKTSIAITKEELWKLVEQFEPDLKIPQTLEVIGKIEIP
ncbi:MAG TPA: hypothetical protein VN873_04705 [Candidatus Angelobacter sp.]|nr:hypothetical protein [Candidatus Angelobacter sp.]